MRLLEAPSPVGFLDPDEPLPFEEIIAPLVLRGRERLAARAGAGGELFGERAQAELERFLLRRLSGLCGEALYLDLAVERAGATTSLGRLLARASAEPPRDLYHRFAHRMRTGGLDAFLDAYPVLKRLAGRLIDLWAESTCELAERLARDAGEVERIFGGGRVLGRVARIEPGLSDPHRGGRTVCALTFESGAKVMYKPKDVGTEGVWNRLLAWLGAHGAPLDLRSLALIERPGYGWVERVEHEPCGDCDAAGRYYTRAGMLLCLVYALAGSDCHRGNLIASGEHPVLVDAECLMQHRVRQDGEATHPRDVALDLLFGGVLGTGMLPSWEVDDDSGERAADVSGLHTVEAHELRQRPFRWVHPGTDAMARVRKEIELPLPQNQPQLDGAPLRLEDHAAEVLDGFESMYRLLVERRAGLLGPDGPLHDLGRHEVRFLFRNTEAYGTLHRRLCDPACLRDDAAREAELQVLDGAARGRGEHWRPLVEAERAAVDRMDIPIFSARAGGVALTLGPHRVLEGCMREPSSERVVQRIGALGPEDLERQLTFVAGSLYANAARHGRPARGVPAGRPAAGGGGRTPVALVPVAVEIAAEMAERAIRAPGNGGVTWIAPQFLPRLERFQLQPVAFDLHSGGAGIALFLASLARVTGDERWARLALEALEPLRGTLARTGGALADDMRFGAATGLGSVVYGLARAGALLDDPDLLADAAAAAALLTADRIERAPGDVFGGLAGEILGMLVLHAAAPDAGLVARAAACGRRLLDARSEGPDGTRAWVTVDDMMLTGFSHGAGGIAYALLRLHAATGDHAFRAAAAEAIGYEDALFDTALGNWPDLRESGRFKANWCHGAPGIGLARLGGLAELDTERVRDDVDAAVRVTLEVPVEGPDYLCCGTLGRIETLLVAGDRLGRPDLTAAARARVQEVVRQARDSGGFTLHESLPRRVYMPGLFQGLAGVGYQLLRAERPRELPSVLLWDA